MWTGSQQPVNYQYRSPFSAYEQGEGEGTENIAEIDDSLDFDQQFVEAQARDDGFAGMASEVYPSNHGLSSFLASSTGPSNGTVDQPAAYT
jgi:hypothetical protein